MTRRDRQRGALKRDRPTLVPGGRLAWFLVIAVLVVVLCAVIGVAWPWSVAFCFLVGVLVGFGIGFIERRL